MDKDKELSELIKDTLAGYEEEYAAGAWENFTAKRKKRRRVVYMRYAAGIAASILLGLIGLNTYENLQPTATISTIKTISTISPVRTISPEQATPESPEVSLAMNPAATSQTGNLAPQKSIGTRGNSSTDKTANSANPANPANTAKPTDITSNSSVTTNATNISVTSSTSNTTISSSVTSSTPNNLTNPSTPPSVTDKKTLPYETPAEQTKRVAIRKIRFGINVAQGVNSTATASAYNYSGGVNVDFPITGNGKLQISTGIQVEHQSVVSKRSVSNTAIPSDLNQASLVNLDFPLNIKWRFLSAKSGSYYIAGGISSLAYLSEKYTTTSQKQVLREAVTLSGSNETITYKLENVETTAIRSMGASNQFDFAGRINISLGFEKQLTPALCLHLEPFLKIPVSGLATENLKFTTSGITCKISF